MSWWMVTIRQAADHFRREVNILRYRVDNHKIIAKTMHFGKLHLVLHFRGFSLIAY